MSKKEKDTPDIVCVSVYLPKELYAEIKKEAEKSLRSISKQIEFTLKNK